MKGKTRKAKKNKDIKRYKREGKREKLNRKKILLSFSAYPLLRSCVFM